MLTAIILLLLLITLNAFFAASEIALISLNDNRIRLLADEGHKKAKLIKNLLDEPSRFLATIQIGITLAGFLASAFASESFSDRIAQALVGAGVPVPEIWLKTISMVLVTMILAYFTLVLGELVPKRLAMKRAEAISMFAATPLNVLSTVTYPFVKLLTLSTNFCVRLFGVDPDEEDEKVTEEEIRLMVDVGGERGTIHESEKLMINNVFEFNNKTADEIMTHRTEISALPVEADLKRVVELINIDKYSRIPIYQGNIDNIVGVLHTRDMAQYIGIDQESAQEHFDLKALIRPPYFVPSSKRTDELFKELQRQKTHMAIILDEYGGTAGIVTIEDLIEEIMGNIFDEYDVEEIEIDKLDDNTFIISGSTSLDLVSEYLKVNLPIEDYDTMGGFIVGQLGRIPKKDEKPSFEFNGLVFKVESVEKRRVIKVKVCRS